MARVLHLLKSREAELPLATIAREVEAGDDVTVALLPGAAAPILPENVRVHRVPSDWNYEQLLEEIFSADQVITW